jgi:hypothetical protein
MRPKNKKLIEIVTISQPARVTFLSSFFLGIPIHLIFKITKEIAALAKHDNDAEELWQRIETTKGRAIQLMKGEEEDA